MKNLIPALSLSTLAAASAVAQVAPSVAKKPAFQHSVEAAYMASSSIQPGADDFEGYNLSARAYVWQNVFVVLEYYTGMTDISDPAPVDVDITRFGYGLGATFQAGPGQLSISYTLGEIEQEAESLGSVEADQDRANITYSQSFGNGFVASLGVTQFFNDEGFGPAGDSTAVILGVGYDFKNGLGVFASYSPDSVDVGVDEATENTYSLGAKFSF